MISECRHGITQCADCLKAIGSLPNEICDDMIRLIDLVQGYYPKSKNALDNLRQRVKEQWGKL